MKFWIISFPLSVTGPGHVEPVASINDDDDRSIVLVSDRQPASANPVDERSSGQSWGLKTRRSSLPYATTSNYPRHFRGRLTKYRDVSYKLKLARQRARDRLGKYQTGSHFDHVEVWPFAVDGAGDAQGTKIKGRKGIAQKNLAQRSRSPCQIAAAADDETAGKFEEARCCGTIRTASVRS